MHDFIKETVKFNAKKGMNSEVYNTYISQTDFSVPAKWNKLGFRYSKTLTQQAANIINKLKLPTRYKSKLYKHNLVEYKYITLLH